LLAETRSRAGHHDISGAFLEKELADFDPEGGTIRFQPDHVIPDAVVRQIVRLRREQIESKLKR
jgi:hypothetical protein